MDMTDCMCSIARSCNNKTTKKDKFREEFSVFHSSSSFPFVLSPDVNDNVPFFLSSTYEATVPEGAEIGTSVAQVSATDLDSGLHGMVRNTHTCTDYLLTSSSSFTLASFSFLFRSTM